jgi:hypothetical protein
MPTRLEYSKGNVKVPFAIVNFCSARECPSRKLGLCQCPKACYADKAERQYGSPLAFRRRQASWWRKATVQDVLALADRLEVERARRASHPVRMLKTGKMSQRKATAKVLRFSEAGDFASQEQINLFAVLADRLIHRHGWTVYGYTARTDLDLTPLLKLGVKVNLSHDSNRYAQGTNRFKVVPEPTGANFVCQGNCRLCGVCRKSVGLTVEVVAH